jgi:hypothetical protein
MVTLTELFQSKQNEMLEQMNLKLPHPVAQGNKTEELWRDFFRNYLPKRYSCDSAFVIDHQGNQSDQIDIVIYDDYFSPFLLNYGTNKYIPAESVYAVFEIKPELNKKNFEYAKAKVSSVRGLLRTSATVLCNGKPQRPRELFSIIGGLLTISNDWKTKITEQAVILDDKGTLDIGCCIQDKSWILKEDSKGEAKYIWSKNEQNSLLTFFMVLLNELQLRGTVPAMEIQKYFDGF